MESSPGGPIRFNGDCNRTDGFSEGFGREGFERPTLMGIGQATNIGFNRWCFVAKQRTDWSCAGDRPDGRESAFCWEDQSEPKTHIERLCL